MPIEQTIKARSKIGPEHDAWLNLTLEEAIDPDLPICDPHHHLWDRPDDRYFLEQFLRDIGGGHNILQTVYVQAWGMYRQDGPEELKSVGETEFAQGMAAQSASGRYGKTLVANGIVGYADLTVGASVERVLEAHIAASPNRFRGVRQGGLSWDPSPEIRSSKKGKGVLLSPKFREGFSCLHKYGLSFDCGIYHTQLMEVVDLAQAFPDTSIVLVHTGRPLAVGPYAGKRDEVFQDWKRGISALASCENVSVKLGGFGKPICGFGWDERPKPPNSTEMAEAMGPYMHFCVDRLGPDRCMFESNFPRDKESCSYTVLWNAFKRIAKDYSADEKRALFHDTAARVYRVTVP